ncbi:hypothetical protein TYRP_000832, partial [Tyrophagus putrescentiae]
MGLGSSRNTSPTLKTVSEQTMRQQNLQVTLKQLQTLMECRGMTMVQAIQTDFGSVEQLCAQLGVQQTEGINPTEGNIALRQNVYGKNQVNFKPPKSFLTLVCRALKDNTLMMLEISAAISFVLSCSPGKDAEDGSDTDYELEQQHDDKYGWIESAAITVSILIIVLVSAGNDYTKERQFRVLQSQLEKEHKVSVLRNRAISEVPVTSLVVGDICLLKYGDIIPADGILFECNELKIDESSLTGESDLVVKSLTADPVILSGTHVMEGGGRMVVTAVGVHSQSGMIYSLMRSGDNAKASGEKGEEEEDEEKDHSVLQKKLRDLALRIGYVGIGITVFTMILLVTKYAIVKFLLERQPFRLYVLKDLLNFLIIGVTILVVAVPEGLPLAVTLSLAYSVRQMMKDNNLVRHLDACETMGNATIICSDKTGTLTANKMTAVKCYLCGTFYHTLSKRFLELPADVVSTLAQSIALNSQPTSQLEKLKDENRTVKQLGNKTECALLGLLFRVHIDYRAVRERFPPAHLHRIYPFNSARKLMRTVICLSSQGFRVLAKGASEIILKKCKYIVGAKGDILELTEKEKDRLTSKVIRKMAQEGLRTILIAYVDYLYKEEKSPQIPPNAKPLQLDSEPDWDAEESYSDLTCLAVIGIEDPIRKDVPEAIVRCQRAGISIRMVTGDNVDTARAIARKCGIISRTAADSDDLVLESKEFNRVIRNEQGKVDQQRFDLVWPRLKVLARSTPADKYTLVKHIIESRLNPNREVVAVTGDGTNDAPALKMADVGFAMGIAGTEVAKEASDIILTDDNFSSIVKAVKSGRNVYDSITKFIQFQLTVNIVAVLIAFISVCIISDSPLKAVQMLWVNLIMDTLGSLALSTEPPSKALLLRKPYGRNKSIITWTMFAIICCNALYQFVILMLLLFVGERFFDIDNGVDRPEPSPASQHYTIIFNAFVLMTLFNEINSRKINGEKNVFSGIASNVVFCSIFVSTAVIQVIIVQFGGISFSTAPLSCSQWLWCLVLGF